MKALILNSRSGGLSESELISSSDSFVYASNIDFHRNPGAITLSAQNMTLFGTDGVINAFAGPYYFTDTGKIYYDSGNLRYTMTSYPNIIYNACYFSGYYYWVTNSSLHRVSLAGSVSTPWNSVQENYSALGNAICYPMLNYYDAYLYIGAGNKLMYIDDTGTLNTAFTMGGNITGITMFGTNIKVYTEEADGGKLYYLGGGGEQLLSIVDFKDLDFRSVVNDGSTDYALTGTNYNLATGAFVATSGYSSAILKRAISRDSLFRFAGNVEAGETNCMCKYKDMIYISSKQGIYSFGNFCPGFDRIFNLDYSIGNDKIGMLKADSEKLYVSYKSGTSYYLDRIDIGGTISSFMSNGELISHVYNGGSFTQSKKIEQIKLGFDKIVEGQKIEIFLKKNGQTDWGSAVAVVDYANISDRGIYFKEFVGPNIDIGPWNFLQIKIKLTAGTSNLTSPKLYELFLGFELQR